MSHWHHGTFEKEGSNDYEAKQPEFASVAMLCLGRRDRRYWPAGSHISPFLVRSHYSQICFHALKLRNFKSRLGFITKYDLKTRSAFKTR